MAVKKHVHLSGMFCALAVYIGKQEDIREGMQ